MHFQDPKVHFQDPKVHFQDPKVHFQDTKVHFRLNGVQVVGKTFLPTTCTPFSRRPAEGGTSGRENIFPYHLYPLQPAAGALLGPESALLGPESALLGPESALWGPESALLGPESALSAEGGTSGRENLFPYTRIPMMMGWGGDRSSLGWMMVQGSY